MFPCFFFNLFSGVFNVKCRRCCEDKCSIAIQRVDNWIIDVNEKQHTSGQGQPWGSPELHRSILERLAINFFSFHVCTLKKFSICVKIQCHNLGQCACGLSGAGALSEHIFHGHIQICIVLSHWCYGLPIT